MIFVVLVVDWRLFFVLCSRCCLLFFVVVVDWFVRSLVVVAVAAVVVIAVGVAARCWCSCGSGYFSQASTFGSMVRSSIEEPARCCINGRMCVCVNLEGKCKNVQQSSPNHHFFPERGVGGQGH